MSPSLKKEETPELCKTLEQRPAGVCVCVCVRDRECVCVTCVHVFHKYLFGF